MKGKEMEKRCSSELYDKEMTKTRNKGEDVTMEIQKIKRIGGEI